MHKRQIGQMGAMLEFPGFVLKMGSATSTTPRERSSALAVSESQKEFLDLAFRMAVMRAALGRSTPTMLVIETPEASLDSFFVERAGRMLRKFTRQGTTTKHTVVASSNLNRENMIPALLGLQGTDDQPTPAAEIKLRLLNLLEIAAKPRALLRNIGHYEAQLADAVRPTKASQPGRARSASRKKSGQ